jgi:hypothetical protein
VGVGDHQLDAAQAALGWSLAELARRAIVGISTIQTIEAHDGPATITGGPAHTLEHRVSARATAVEAIRDALESAGVTFLPDDGRAGPGLRVKIKSRGRR